MPRVFTPIGCRAPGLKCHQEACPKASKNLRMPSAVSSETVCIVSVQMGADRHTLGSHLVTWHCWLLCHHAGQGGFGCSTSKQKGHDLLWVFLTFSPRWHLCCNWCHPKLTTNFIAHFDFSWLDFALVIHLRSCRQWFEVLGSINVLLPWWEFLNFLILSQGCDWHTHCGAVRSEVAHSRVHFAQDTGWYMDVPQLHHFNCFCLSKPSQSLVGRLWSLWFSQSIIKVSAKHRAAEQSDHALNQSMYFKPANIFFFSVMIWIYNNIASCTSATVGGKNRAWIKYRQKWGNNIFKFQCLHKSVGEPLSSL